MLPPHENTESTENWFDRVSGRQRSSVCISGLVGRWFGMLAAERRAGALCLAACFTESSTVPEHNPLGLQGVSPQFWTHVAWLFA